MKLRAISSEVEHYLDTVGVTGSIPVSPIQRILGGVKICSGSVIGAGAVVTKDIPANSVAVGVPAKVIKKTF